MPLFQPVFITIDQGEHDQNNALEPIPFRNLPAGVLYGASHLEKIDRAKNEELFTAQVGTFEGLKKECVKKLICKRDNSVIDYRMDPKTAAKVIRTRCHKGKPASYANMILQKSHKYPNSNYWCQQDFQQGRAHILHVKHWVQQNSIEALVPDEELLPPRTTWERIRHVSTTESISKQLPNQHKKLVEPHQYLRHYIFVKFAAENDINKAQRVLGVQNTT